MSLTVDDGALIRKDPSDISVYTFDWDARALTASATITTSTWTITAIRPVGDSALTSDSTSILAGSRKTQIRLTAGTLGASYLVTNRIVTNESPTQTKERSITILVQDL